MSQGTYVGTAMHYGDRIVSFRTTDASTSIARFVPHDREDKQESAKDEEPGLYRGESLVMHNAKIDRLYTLRDINRFNRRRPDSSARRQS